MLSGNSNPEPESPVIALAARHDQFPSRFNWLLDQGFALEYTPDADALELLPEHVTCCLEAGVPLRFHARFPGYEIGHMDQTAAARALALHLELLERIKDYAATALTLHIGLNPKDPIDPGRALDNLSRLVRRGAESGVAVYLENLRRGLTADPELLADWASQSGAGITVDLGHAAGTEIVLHGGVALADYLKPLLPRVQEAHVYGIETDRHYPPAELAQLAPAVARLADAGCRWWTIELDDTAEISATKSLLEQSLAQVGTIDFKKGVGV